MIRNLENRAFILLLIAVTTGFLWLLFPFYSAIFWAAIVAILFNPLNQYLLRRQPGRPTLAALITVLCSLLLVIIPVTLLFLSLGIELVELYRKVTEGNFTLQPLLDRVYGVAPFLERYVNDWASSWEQLKETLSDKAMESSRAIASQAVQFGQGYLSFVINAVLMLYLTFFFLRDGHWLIKLFIRALPLGDDREQRLFTKFAEVCRATVKGNLLVATVQGTIGGIAFALLGIPGALLWGTVMIVLSLLPAVGSALVWAPAAIWLIVDGAYVKGGILIAVGVFVIGTIDNVLRPVLVGRDTQMPDYLVLISTLGGLTLFGLNGFILGPVLAALFLVIWQIFMEEYRPDPNPGPFNAPSEDSAVTDHAEAHPLLDETPGSRPASLSRDAAGPVATATEQMADQRGEKRREP